MTEITNHQNIEKLFLSNFVHQVINPLNGVIGTLDNIGDEEYSENIRKLSYAEETVQLNLVN